MSKVPNVNLKSRTGLPVFTDEELTALAERIGMTLDQLKRFGNAAWRTYQAIGSDLAQIAGPNMKRYEVVETVLDADHILAYGHMEADLKEWYHNRFKKDFKLEHYYEAVAAVAFQYARYE